MIQGRRGPSVMNNDVMVSNEKQGTQMVEVTGEDE